MDISPEMPDGAVTVRPVSSEDAQALADIYNPYVTDTTVSFETEPLTAADMRQRIVALAGTFPYFVCECGGEVAGYCYAHPWKERVAYRHTFETSVYLSPCYAGRGIGRKLMEVLIAACRAMGCHALIACVTQENAASIAFHKRLGFVPVSRFVGVGEKFGRRLDIVDLELQLA